MANVTIADLAPLTPPMDGSELLEIERGGDSFKIESGQLAQAPAASVAVESGAAPVDIDPLGLLYVVTTGATGDEILNVLNPTVDDNGSSVAFIGRPLIIYVPALTDPADRVLITVAGGGTIPVFSQPTLDGISAIKDVVLDYAGALIALTWTGNEWAVNFQVIGSSGFFGSSPATITSTSLTGGDAANGHPAQGSVVRGGNGDETNPDGAAGTLSGGSAVTTGAAGDAVLKAGSSVDGLPGNAVIELGQDGAGNWGGWRIFGTLPTADPEQAGYLFTTGAVGPGTPRQLWISGGTS